MQKSIRPAGHGGRGKEGACNPTKAHSRFLAGLLHATQFTQPALVLVEKAAYEELLNSGFVGQDIVFAGHSLGEYAALGSVANVLSLEQLVEVVFLRGMTMQGSVARDESGRSDFGMMVASPNRVARPA